MDALILFTDILEKLILVMLIGLSIWSIAIIFEMRKTFKKEKQIPDLEVLLKSLNERNFALAKNWSQKHQSFVARALHAGFHAPATPESVDRAVSAFVKSERISLERGMSLLATLGANAPFIGLFGTVLGIIRAFAYLGSQTGSAAVMSGVSQALYATAAGLFVAIPAVVAFNYFSKQMRDLILQLESLRDAYISQLGGERH